MKFSELLDCLDFHPSPDERQSEVAQAAARLRERAMSTQHLEVDAICKRYVEVDGRRNDESES